jgi:hypothetical protein
MAQRALHHRLALFADRHVASLQEASAPELFDLGRGVLQLAFGAGADSDVGALTGKSQRDHPADAAASTGNQSYFVG